MNKLVLLIAILAAPSMAAAEKALALDKSGTHDCTANPSVSIGNGGGTYTLKGKCTKIQLGGGKNTLTIESVEKLQVGGGGNTITVTSVDTLEVGGAKNTIAIDTVGEMRLGGVDNTITWKKAKTGDKPGMKGQADKNKITQTK